MKNLITWIAARAVVLVPISALAGAALMLLLSACGGGDMPEEDQLVTIPAPPAPGTTR